MKRFLFSTDVKQVEGTQIIRIDAESAEEAMAMVNSGRGEIYVEELCVLDVGPFRFDGETDINDFGDFPIEIALPVLEQQEKLLSLMPPSYCIKCDNTGQMDSGGTQPWGDAIMVACDCQAKPSTTPQIDNDGWIELVDAEMPVHPDSVVEVKMRNGATDGPREAARFFWYRGNEVRDEMGCDIIAYRVIENDGREG